MKKILLLLLGTLCLSSLPPAVTGEDAYRALTLQGIDYGYNLQFEQATATFDRLIALDPDDPIGYLLQCVNYFYRLRLEERGERLADGFKRYNSEAIKRARKGLSNHESRLDALFYLGTSQIYLAAYHANENNWVRAYWFGKDGIEHLEKVVALQPDYYDAYLGLGIYHYYADVMPRFLKTVSAVLGIDGDRARGLRELQLAADKGTFSQAEALFFLGDIYLNMEREYGKAIQCSQRLVDLYPSNVGFRTFYAENLQKAGRHREAVNVLAPSIDAANAFPLLKLLGHFTLANTYFELNDFEQAITHYQGAIELAFRSGAMKWARAWSQLRLGDSYSMLRRPGEAAEQYRRTTKSDHEGAYKLAQQRLKGAWLAIDVDMTHGQNLVKTRNFAEAVELFEQATARTEANVAGYPRRRLPELRHNLGKAHFHNGAYERAILEFTTVVEMQAVPEPWIKPWAHYFTGRCYLALGRKEQALAQFTRAYRFDDSELRFQIDRIREDLGLSSTALRKGG